MLPDRLQTTLEKKHQITVLKTLPVSGGSINHAFRLSTNKGDLFLKWNPDAPDDFFEKEAQGLALLKSANSGVRIPDVLAVGKPASEAPGFLLMEFVNQHPAGNSFGFGAGLAKLHQTTSGQFGLKTDNYIGSLPQSNRQHPGWSSFFVEERIGPQLKKAVDGGIITRKLLAPWERLAGQLDDLLPPCRPSLLHGDLWGGNYLFDDAGTAVLIDPAVYFGHPEMDLAFSRMFGGFDREFYHGYESVSPLEGNFEERVPVYNLYPLLVHVNLFGGHYASQCVRFLKQF